MLISAEWLIRFWGVQPKGVVHVGAHLAEESPSYIKHNFGPCVWVEANPRLIPFLEEKLKKTDDFVIESAIWEESGRKLDLNIANNSLSTSLFEFGLHSEKYPSVKTSEIISVTTKRLDEVLPKNFLFNFVNLDIQGAELSALKSLGSRINEVDYIFTEVNKRELYKSAPTVKQLDDFLFKEGFKRVVTCWVPLAGWGDAFYVRDSLKSNNFVLRSLGTVATKNFHIRYVAKKIIQYTYRIPRGYLINKVSMKIRRNG